MDNEKVNYILINYNDFDLFIFFLEKKFYELILLSNLL